MFKRTVFIFMGLVGGFFLGATLGLVLGPTVGGAIDILGIKLNSTVEPIFGTILGLLFSVIIGSSLLVLGKIVLPGYKLSFPVLLICTAIGLVTGFTGGTTFRGPITNFKFIIFGGTVGIWTGMVVGAFVGGLLFYKAGKFDDKDTRDEKKKNDAYAQFLKEKTGQK